MTRHMIKFLIIKDKEKPLKTEKNNTLSITENQFNRLLFWNHGGQRKKHNIFYGERKELSTMNSVSGETTPQDQRGKDILRLRKTKRMCN